MRPDERLEAEIQIAGRVQGVGFRPFIYRKAVGNGLRGHVINLGDAGVEVVVEGTTSQIRNFIDEVKTDAPEVSEVENIRVVYRPFRNRFGDFKIERSKNSERSSSGALPPDITICSECVEDMSDPESRWYDYPFTACAWCGPRFTAVRSLPYDRERTHMAKFPMCKHCGAEYRDPMDRRFDAQGITCSLCGPKMTLHDASGSALNVPDVFERAADLLMEGNVIAIKGIGGVHVAAIATDDEVVMELRRRKRRPQQPFALMSPDFEAITSYATPSVEEESVLKSWQRPIVLLKKKQSSEISDLVAPGLDRVGVMLPYTGIHVVLFNRLRAPAIIMTSGNKPGLPMAITNEDAVRDLAGIADYFLLHDREIVNRCDDSVLRVIRGQKAFTRRSRGYVPDPIELPFKNGVSLAVGAELRNAGAIAHDGRCYMTQYLGDITSLESLEYERRALEHLRGLSNITRNPDVIGCDLHPDYMTSHLADEISRETHTQVVKSQHHHAHINAVSAENNISPDEVIIGIALDGAGYGSDGAIWGGEVIKSNYSSFERVGHLEYLPMPGGDLCAAYPLRMLIAALSNAISDDEIRDITQNHVKMGLPHGEKELELILKLSREGKTIKTSSCGRYLDAIAALTGVCYVRTYEGEPAMKVESLAGNEAIQTRSEIEDKNGDYVLKTSNILLNMCRMMKEKKIERITAFGQNYLVNGIAEIAIRSAEKNNIKKIGLSGGVCVNEFILTRIFHILSDKGFEVICHKNFPPGDGGIALGQSIAALSSVI